MKFALSLLLLGLTLPAYGEPEFSEEEYTQLINQFSDCAGFFEVAALLAQAGEEPASAQQYSELGNGANMAALYLLALDYNEKHEEQKAIGEFSVYVMARSETTKTRLLAIIESEDEEAFHAEGLKCANLLKLQEALVQQMRDEMYRQ